MQEVSSHHEKEFLYIEGGKALEQAVQGNDGISLSGDIQEVPSKPSDSLIL